jgi:hypothetical protein
LRDLLCVALVHLATVCFEIHFRHGSGFFGREKGRNLAANCGGNKGRAAYFQNLSETNPDLAAEEETVPQKDDG